ncbi:hypothetical protein Trydic_g18423 [Trypoxylus dichotomus]
MNKNTRLVDQGAKKVTNKAVPSLHNSYTQRFLNTAAHKNLESALKQKLNFAFNKQRPITPASRKQLEIEYFDDDHLPHYLNAKEKLTETKPKKSPSSSPQNVSKTKNKEVTPFTLSKINTKQNHTIHKEVTKASRETTRLGNKTKDMADESSKKTKAKGPNTLLHKEPVVELPMATIPMKKIKEPVSATAKERSKLTSGKTATRKEIKGDKKIGDTQKKNMKSSGLKSKKVQ